jgi:hypothetical protein
MAKQMMIVAAIICLRNFIRENHAHDKDFRKCDRNLIMCPLYLQDIGNIIFPKTQEIQSIRNLMIAPWINSEMILRGPSFFLDHSEQMLCLLL